MRYLSIFITVALFVNLSQPHLFRANPRGDQIQGEVTGIIVSFKNGQSYDRLFQQVKQQSKEGTVVLTYIASSSYQKQIVSALKGDFSNSQPILRQLAAQIDRLSPKCPQCIVFNWECSSGYSGEKFNEQQKDFYNLLNFIINRGYLAMFSDFSLKALIANWKQQALGPNPFIKVGQTSTPIIMKYNKDKLLRSPSSQLKTVAQLSQKSQLQINVLGGTIIYGVNQRRAKTQKYHLQVLSIASNFPSPQSHLQSKIDDITGLACHVLISYANGGKILTSMGHWIQIVKINTTIQRLFNATENLYGSQKAKKMRRQYESFGSAGEQKAYLTKMSNQMIQQQSPGSNMQYLQGKEEKQENDL